MTVHTSIRESEDALLFSLIYCHDKFVTMATVLTYLMLPICLLLPFCHDV